jgi:hypothetical protein
MELYMNINEQKSVIMTLRKLSVAIPSFAPKFDEQFVCEVWLENLSDLSLEEIGRGCKQAINSCNTFPSIAQIKSYVGKKEPSDKEVAEDIVNAIWDSLVYGNNPSKACEKMGTVAWEVAGKIGSWYDIVNNTDYERPQWVKKSWLRIAERHLYEVRSNTVGQYIAIPEDPRSQTLALEAQQTQIELVRPNFFDEFKGIDALNDMFVKAEQLIPNNKTESNKLVTEVAFYRRKTQK